MAAQVGPRDEADRAGRSAQATYERHYGEWRASRAAAALRLVPPGLLAAVLGGWYLTATTGIRLFGVLFAGLVVGAVADLLLVPPHVVRDWRQAAAGERATGRLLARLERDGYLALHDRTTLREQVAVEHLLIGPSGLFVLDSRQWAAAKTEVRVLSGRLWVGLESQADLLAEVRSQAAGVAREVSSALPTALAADVAVAGVLVVHGKRVAGAPRLVDGVAVMEAGQLPRYLSRLPRVWDAGRVHEVAAAADRVTRPRDA
jgi:hypothetical protein